MIFNSCTSRADSERASARGARAFSLIELLVCIGMIMIMISLVLPALGRSIENSRNVRDCAQIRQNWALVTLYAGDQKDTYPLAQQNPFLAGEWWWDPLRKSGHIESKHEVDPVIFKRFGVITIVMSVCLVYSPEYMLPGRTRPVGDARSSPVRQHQVSFPSSKGGMFRQSSGEGTVSAGARWFCCGRRWEAAVGMCDGSTFVTDYSKLNRGEPPLQVDWIGTPVWTTWGGYLARDR